MRNEVKAITAKNTKTSWQLSVSGVRPGPALKFMIMPTTVCISEIEIMMPVFTTAMPLPISRSGMIARASANRIDGKPHANPNTKKRDVAVNRDGSIHTAIIPITPVARPLPNSTIPFRGLSTRAICPNKKCPATPPKTINIKTSPRSISVKLYTS